MLSKIQELLNYTFFVTDDIRLRVKGVIVIILIFVLTWLILKFIKKIALKKIPASDKNKFISLFSTGKWFIYLIIFLIVINSIGVNITAFFAASAALLVGIGLALQTLIQDIISGILIIVDQSLHIGDIIEVDDKMGRVENIKLRTTRVITTDNRVVIVPNHLFLTNSLYNYTSNSEVTRENIAIGVAYGSDLELVKKILLQIVNMHPDVLKDPKPVVLFMDFGDSSLNFRLAFSVKDSFNARFPKSDIRFEIDRLFRENNITIPFPQRDVHIYKNN